MSDSATDREHEFDVSWLFRPKEAAVNPVELAVEDRAAFCRAFGGVTISLTDTRLMHRRAGGDTYALAPLGNDWFAFESTDRDHQQLRFVRDASGDMAELFSHMDDGRSRRPSRH